MCALTYSLKCCHRGSLKCSHEIGQNLSEMRLFGVVATVTKGKSHVSKTSAITQSFTQDHVGVKLFSYHCSEFIVAVASEISSLLYERHLDDFVRGVEHCVAGFDDDRPLTLNKAFYAYLRILRESRDCFHLSEYWCRSAA
jgi:hypothetical protein